MSVKTINPATGEMIATYQESTASDIHAILNKMKAAQATWADFSFLERQKKMLAVVLSKRVTFHFSSPF